jgi:hypothetical protein
MSWSMAAAPALYLVGAALLVAASRRWVRPLSRWATVALVLLPLCFVGRALATGRIYAPFNLSYSTEPLEPLAPAYDLDDTARYPRRGILHDVNSQMMPWRAAVRLAWERGEWPLWNPYMLAGDPLAGSAQSAPYDPLHLWSLLLPLAASWTPVAGLRFLLNALGMFALLRRLGCRESVAFAGGAAWTFSAFCAFWHDWPLGATLGLLPLLVDAIERLLETPDRRSGAQLAAVLALAILAGHPESLVHLVGGGAAWGLIRLAGRELAWPRRGRVVARAAAAGAGAVLLCAFFLAPFLEVLVQSANWRLRSGPAAALNQSASWEEAGRSILRVLLPPLDSETRAWMSNPILSGYAGSILWIPALAALLAPGGRRRLVLSTAGLGALGLLLAARAPGLTEALRYVPVVNRTFGDRFVVLVPFALVLLAALGWESWRAGSLAGRRAWLLAHGAVAVAAVLLAGLAATDLPGPGVERARALRSLAWMALVPLAAAVAAVAARGRQRLAWGLLIGLLLVERSGEMGGFYPTLPADAFFPRPAVLAAMAASEEPYRVVGANWAMPPNTSVHWMLEDPRGYQPTRHWRFAAVEPLWTHSDSTWFGRVDDLRSPWLPFLNVRYALTGWQAPPRGWREVARSDPKGTRLLRAARAAPRAFLPARLRLAPQPGTAIAELARAENLETVAWIETGTTTAPNAPRAEIRNAQGRVALERVGSGYRLTGRLNRPGWIVVSDTAWRGWRAYDATAGRAVTLGFANHAFLAVPHDGGRRTIELRYIPATFAAGLVASVATALSALVFAGRPREDLPKGPP